MESGHFLDEDRWRAGHFAKMKTFFLDTNLSKSRILPICSLNKREGLFLEIKFF